LQEALGAHIRVATRRLIDIGVHQKANGAFFRATAAAVGTILSFDPRGDPAVADQSPNGFFVP
jgi:hypothetical protein